MSLDNGDNEIDHQELRNLIKEKCNNVQIDDYSKSILLSVKEKEKSDD